MPETKGGRVPGPCVGSRLRFGPGLKELGLDIFHFGRIVPLDSGLSAGSWFQCFLAETFGRSLVGGPAFMPLQTPLPVGSDLSGLFLTLAPAPAASTAGRSPSSQALCDGWSMASSVGTDRSYSGLWPPEARPWVLTTPPLPPGTCFGGPAGEDTASRSQPATLEPGERPA